MPAFKSKRKIIIIYFLLFSLPAFILLPGAVIIAPRDNHQPDYIISAKIQGDSNFAQLPDNIQTRPQVRNRHKPATVPGSLRLSSKTSLTRFRQIYSSRNDELKDFNSLKSFVTSQMATST